MNLRPLCTAMVWPTISGTTVDRRDQVLRTFLSLFRFITSTFSRRGTSTKGPFFSDLDILLSSARCAYERVRSAELQLRVRTARTFQRGAEAPRYERLFRSPLHDEPIRDLPVPRLVALGRHAPRRHRVAAARGLAFAAAERVVHRVHRHE